MDAERHSTSRRDARKRSRSPWREKKDSETHVKRRRSHSPHHRSKHRHREQPSPNKRLPFRSQHLHKRDFETYKSLFAEYLDLQKQLDIDLLEQDEVKGRWKSFLGKWNRGDLPEGWYDPDMKRKADERWSDRLASQRSDKYAGEGKVAVESQSEEEEDDDGYGPSLPRSHSMRRGPAAPGFQDLQHRRELAEEEQHSRIADLRYERKQDRKLQKERLDDLAPRAEPGTRERQLEKRREAAASNRSFAEAKEEGAEEVGDGDLMGDDGVENYKAKMQRMEKQKNEREIRKEEVLRARAVEREEKLAEHRRKEEKTMEMLKDLAKQRFGGQG